MGNVSNFFYCYDRGLATWLKHVKLIKHNCTGYHIRTNDQFWQFTHTDKLSMALIEYSAYQKSTSICR